MEKMDSQPQPEWWPARQMRRNPIRRVYGCGHRLNPPAYSHVVDFPRVEIPIAGVYLNQIEVGDRIDLVSLRPGTALFAPPNCWNLPEWQPGLVLLSILFGRTQLSISLVSAPARSYPQVEAHKFSLPKPVAGPVPHILAALDEHLAAEGSEAALTDLANALIHCVEDLLRSPITAPVSHAKKLLEEIRVFLQSHYQYEITRDSVAQQFAISPNHLSRLFQTQGRTTFSAYLTQVRIERAKHLLRNYNLKLDDIAARCGYNDTPYFCHVFKNLTRVTPKEYRLKALRTNPLPAGAQPDDESRT
jgi:AraC-like DNA-binding protein